MTSLSPRTIVIILPEKCLASLKMYYEWSHQSSKTAGIQFNTFSECKFPIIIAINCFVIYIVAFNFVQQHALINLHVSFPSELISNATIV